MKRSASPTVKVTHPYVQLVNQADTAFVLGHWEEAFSLYKIAHEQKPNGHVYYRLGVMYFQGHGTKQDLNKANDYFCQALNLMHFGVSNGDASALCDLGCMYFNGYGVPEEKNLAFTYFEQSAAQDYAPAQYNLGVIYESNDIVAKDPSMGFKYFQLAADKQHVGAQFNMACSYSNGDGVEMDLQKALKYYLLASEQGDDEALFNIGLMYFNGEGVEKDVKTAIQYYMNAAAKENSAALYTLAKLYQKGKYLKEDQKEAIKLYEQAASKGYPKATLALGRCYQQGLSAKQDLSKALHYFLLASTLTKEPNLKEEAQNHLSNILKGSSSFGIKYQKVAIYEILVSQWPSTHKMVHSLCQEAILELFYMREYMNDFLCVPVELVVLVVQWLIMVWTDSHYESIVKGLKWSV